jgi:hypothetical protein
MCTLIIEAINSVNLRTLVVSSQQKEVFWVLDFVSEKQANGFEGLSTAVHVVFQEEVVGFRWGSTVLEES